MMQPTLSMRAYFLRSPSHYLPFAWRWSNFSFAELESRDGTGLLLVPRQLDLLQQLRDAINAPLTVHSHYRSTGHNLVVGGAKDSYHLSGMATDCSCRFLSLDDLANTARKVGFTGIGRYPTFVHVDIGPARQWQE